MLVIQAAGVGQAQAARRALQQRDAEAPLKPGDAGTDGGRRHAEQAGGGAEAPGIDDFDEHGGFVEVHCSFN